MLPTIEALHERLYDFFQGKQSNPNVMTHYYILKRLWQYVRKYRPKLLLIAFISLIGVFFEVLKPFPIKLIIDNVLSDHPLPVFMAGWFQGTDLLATKERLLYACFAVMVVITVVSFVLTLSIFNLTVRLAQGLVYDLMVDFFNKLQRLSLSFYARNKVGDLLQRITGDAFVVYFLVAQIILPAITSLVCLSAMFYIMAKINLGLALIAFAVVPALIITLAFFAKPMSDTTATQYKMQGLFSAFLQQSLSSVKIIQAFSRESFMNEKIKQHAAQFSNAYIVANRVSMTYNQLSVLITGIAAAILVFFGAWNGINGKMSAGDLFIFLGYISALYGPVNMLASAIGTTIAIGSRGKRVFEIMDSAEVVKEKTQPATLFAVNGAVEFQNVSFGYTNEQGLNTEVLRDISFKVKAGEIVAIVGPTGAGKTSMISLLARFYDPWKGKVLLDGVNIKDLKLEQLRANVSLVLQEPFIFPMSIGENIAFGNPNASFEEIVEVAKMAQAHDFISKLPGGYDTLISESGASLSGGEKQRIAIARAFLKNAPVLIMDEPTSAMDALTESRIFKALNKFSKGKTVFIISHRLSTIKHADQIITIQNGKVVESGTHDALMESGSTYAELYKHHHIN